MTACGRPDIDLSPYRQDCSTDDCREPYECYELCERTPTTSATPSTRFRTADTSPSSGRSPFPPYSGAYRIRVRIFVSSALIASFTSCDTA